MNSQNPVNVYDFDHTIYHGDASFDFILYCLMRNPRLWKYLPASALAVAQYIFGISDRKRVKQVAFRFLRDMSDIDKTLNEFWTKHELKIKQWYRNQHQASDIVISASPEFLLDPIAKKLKIQALLATRMDKHSGEINGENCREEEKLRRLKEYDAKLKPDNVYSDSWSDAPLLGLANRAYIVKRHTITLLDKEDLIWQASEIHKEATQSRKALVRELFLYGIIGGSTAALDVVLFKVFITIGVPLLIANFMSVSVAVGSSFILNAKYNFKKTDNLHKRGAKFFAIGYFGWLVQTIILWIGVDRMGFQDLYVKLIAVFVAAAIQYVLNKFLTFKG